MSNEWKMVPGRMLLDKETIGVINFHCGAGSNLAIEECSEGMLWVGTVTDDDGKPVYGLHISTAEYPEEGSSTLVEFAAPVPPAGGDVVPLAWLDRSVDSGVTLTDAGASCGMDGTELVDIDHVTRLTADRDKLKAHGETTDKAYKIVVDESRKLFEETQRLQAELTKAQNLLATRPAIDAKALHTVLSALCGPAHHIRELQVCRGLPGSPIDQLQREFNDWLARESAPAERPEPISKALSDEVAGAIAGKVMDDRMISDVAGIIRKHCLDPAPDAKGTRETVDLNLREPSFYRNRDND